MAPVSLGELERRVNAMATQLDELDDLVDGHAPFSHRVRLHHIEETLSGERLVATALDELRQARDRNSRATLTLLLAGIAIAVNIGVSLAHYFGH